MEEIVAETQRTQKPYTTFWAAWTAARNKADREKVYLAVQEGKFGTQVKHSVFGIGDYDASYDHTPERIRELNSNMRFYARLEK
jgi:hypothetical protein